jgi:hypothetical protein
MARVTDALLAIARAALAEHLRPMGRVAVRHDPARSEGVARAARAAPAEGDDVIGQLARRVGARLEPAADNAADVEFVEHTPLGARATVVPVRNGKVRAGRQAGPDRRRLAANAGRPGVCRRIGHRDLPWPAQAERRTAALRPHRLRATRRLPLSQPPTCAQRECEARHQGEQQRHRRSWPLDRKDHRPQQRAHCRARTFMRSDRVGDGR